MSGIQRTLVLLKPDSVKRGLMGRIVARFEDAGLKIVGVRMAQMDADLVRQHYFDLEDRWGRSVYDMTAQFMTSGPVIALAIEGVEAVPVVRKLVGATFPNESAPGTIRGDFAHLSKAYTDVLRKSICNLVHASGSAEEAEHELRVWFSDDAIYEYQTLAESYVF